MKKLLILTLWLTATMYGNGQSQDSLINLNKDTVILADTVQLVDSLLVSDSTIISDSVLLADVLDTIPEKSRVDTLSFIGVGDMMLGTNFPDESYMPPRNGKGLLSEVSKYLRDADITFGNLEGVVLDSGGIAKKCKNPDICYLFRSPKAVLNELKDSGFDVLSTANNHVNDFGLPGRELTSAALEEFGFHYAGFDNKPSVIFRKDSLTIGMAAFAPNNGTASMYDITEAQRVVAELDSICDIVIVSVHGGAEGKDYQHITRENEYFYGHNRGNMYDFSRKMIDSGADMIFGHGPHVTRAVDVYKDRFIAYSLGNFCTYRRFNLSGPNGYAPVIKVYTDEEGKFLFADVLSIRQPWPGGPVIDSKNTAFDFIRNLTAEDIPESPVIFKDNQIYPVK